jgi:hypothetical protein
MKEAKKDKKEKNEVITVDQLDIFKIKSATQKIQIHQLKLEVEQLKTENSILKSEMNIKAMQFELFKIQQKKETKNEYVDQLDKTIEDLETKYNTTLKNKTINEFTGELITL